MREQHSVNVAGFAREVSDLFMSSESERKLFRKLLMKHIDMPNKYSKYTMDIEYEQPTYHGHTGDRATVDSYHIYLRKNCTSPYKKEIAMINENFVVNHGVGYGNNSGIKVEYNLEEFCKLYLRERKLIQLLYEQ